MKRILLLLVNILILTTLAAQNYDSIAVSKISQYGLYYFINDTLKRITPITYAGIKGSAGFMSGKGKMVFLKERSDNKLKEQVLYCMFTSSLPSNSHMICFIKNYEESIQNFLITTLKAKKGNREMEIVKIGLSGSKVGENFIELRSEKIGDNLYKLNSVKRLTAGQYGVFYNFGGGAATALFDFEVK